MKHNALKKDVQNFTELSRRELDGRWNEGIISKLNQLLTNEFGIFTKTLKYHWDVSGTEFISLHELFQKQYEHLLKIIDNLAERIRIIGGYPVSTLTEVNERLQITEQPNTIPDCYEMLTNLNKDHVKIQNEIISILEGGPKSRIDLGSEDLLISVLKKHEKMSWILRSHVTQTEAA